MWGRLLLSVMVLAVAAAHSQYKHRCPILTCPEIYRPLCGTDGKTYDNQCYFAQARCNDRTLRVAHRGECEECPKVCTLEYDPVCGTDGVTYGNPCQLNAQRICEGPRDLTIKHRGRCEEPKDCPDVCPAVFDPVCGSDGKTYSNSCVLGIEICNGADVHAVHDGPCRPRPY